MLPHLGFALAVLTAATVFALLEVQIEGAQGWAAGLPTWKIDNRFTRLLCGQRPLTGYHFYVHLFVLTMLHLPYALFLVVPSWHAELRLAGFLLLFFITEDFLWFLFNPHFGLGRFRREQIWWHARVWWWVMPRDYWVCSVLGVLLYVLSWRVGSW
jgi:hypothetical protein